MVHFNGKFNRISVFDGLNETQMMKIQEITIEEEFCKGDYLFKQGDPPEWLYIISKGRVKLVKHAATGSSTIIEIYSAGDELTAGALLEGKPYPASAKALTDGVIWKISNKDFKRLVFEWPVVTQNILKDLGAKYRGLVENISSLAVFKVEGRICKVMADLARRFGIFGDCRGIILDLSLTRQDLADITGTTLETTIRTLNKLKEGGLICWEGKRFFIPDLHALENTIMAS